VVTQFHKSLGGVLRMGNKCHVNERGAADGIPFRSRWAAALIKQKAEGCARVKIHSLPRLPHWVSKED